jgi:drug/metabolite transporter (DMT)-like permease
MRSIKCSGCGLVNFETQTVCKRCGGLLNSSSSIQNARYSNSQNSGNTMAMAITRNQEIIAGILSILAGLFALVMNWMSAIHSAKFYTSATILAPICIAFGLCFLLIPYPQKEHFPKAEFAPKSWAYLIIPGFILGILNWLYFMGIV